MSEAVIQPQLLAAPTRQTRRELDVELSSKIEWPRGFDAELQQIGLALQRIREDAKLIVQLMPTKRHHRQARITGRASDIRGLATRSLVALIESPFDPVPRLGRKRRGREMR